MIFVGDKLYGFCSGYFGRDSYGEKTVLFLTREAVVVRDNEGAILVAQHPEIHEILDAPEHRKDPDYD